MEHGPLTIADQVALATQRYDQLEHLGRIQGSPDDDLKIRTPNPCVYALGWIVANAIVQERYSSSAIDAIPIYHPEHGWDRFLLSRRVACDRREQERADRFGLILLRGDNAPHLASHDETIQLSLGELLRQDPGAAIRNLLDLVPEPRFDSGDHQQCWHTRAAKEYPLLYDVITHLIIEHPGLIAAREIHIDEIQVDGAFHPLYIHTGGQITGFTYDWFGIESGDALTYIRLHGRRAVSRTERGTWQSSGMPIGSLDWTAMRTEIATRLHLDNEHPTLAI